LNRGPPNFFSITEFFRLYILRDALSARKGISHAPRRDFFVPDPGQSERRFVALAHTGGLGTQTQAGSLTPQRSDEMEVPYSKELGLRQLGWLAAGGTILAGPNRR